MLEPTFNRRGPSPRRSKLAPESPPLNRLVIEVYRAAGAVYWLLGMGTVLSVGCVQEGTLFQSTAGAAGNSEENAGATGSGEPGMGFGAGAAGSSGKGPGTAGPVWTEAKCVTALSQGKTGEFCSSPFKCSATSGCCQVVASCEGGLLAVKSACNDCAASCTVDADCGFGRLCEAYHCRDCSKEPCPPTWIVASRNGCSVCVPPSECHLEQDPACGTGQICVAGLTCLPGCKSDPACCFGNQCALAGCGPLDAADCLVVGCAPLSMCKVASEAMPCTCDGKSGKWVCEKPPINTCIPTGEGQDKP